MVTGLDVLRPGKNTLQPVVVNNESGSNKFITPVKNLPGVDKKPDREIAMNDNIEKDVVTDEKNMPPEPGKEETGTTPGIPSDDDPETEQPDSDKINDK